MPRPATCWRTEHGAGCGHDASGSRQSGVLPRSWPWSSPSRCSAGPAAECRARAARPLPGRQLTDTVVTCGGTASWPVSAMIEGGPGRRSTSQPCGTSSRRLEAEAGIDAPQAIQEQGAAAAPYIVLAVDADTGEVTLGLGAWARPRVRDEDAQVARPGAGRRTGTRAAGWGDCRQPRGRAAGRPVAGRGDRAGWRRRSVRPPSLEVLVNEIECTSAPRPAAISRRAEGRRDRRPGPRHARQ